MAAEVTTTKTGELSAEHGDYPWSLSEKLPPAGTMPGVSFHASDKREAGSGPGIVLFGGNRPALSNELWYFEPTGDGWVQLFPSGGVVPPPRTQATLNVIGEDGKTKYQKLKMQKYTE